MLNKPASPIAALVRALRPRQAPKNLFVFAALIFANELSNRTALVRVILAFLLFSVISGSVYLLNDILDVEQDRRHPKKRLRPIASGELSVPLAKTALVVLAATSTAASWWLNPRFGFIIASYFVMNVAYCIWLKHVVLLDVFTIATGFLLRTIAGGFVIGVHISHWLLLCTLQLALFLGFLKRRQEIVEQGDNADKTRAILEEYSIPFLDQMITIVAGVSIVCYSVYTVESDTARNHPHLWLTVPVVIYGICRYLYLVYQKQMGGAPEEVLRTDRWMQVTLIVWFLLIVALFRFDTIGNPLFGLIS